MEHPAEILRHDRVVLRRWRNVDADIERLTLIGLEAQERLKPWMPWAATHSRESVVEYLTAADQGWAKGEAYNYAIMGDGPNSLPVGSTSMMRRIGPGGFEIGYWIHQDWSGQGLVTMAAAAQAAAAFALVGTDRVEIHHDSENHASGAVPARLGFTEVDRHPDEGRIEVVWRIVRADAERQPWWGVS
ncbi:GNAT family N-acetyltransferase [Streptacidiphilus sp. MAP5-3]|uniref:GNAT family N-acetyltransferase n=1 Tax=unclassified Streptacidiphilus TaxID=2643834 RepID=UPI00351501A1